MEPITFSFDFHANRNRESNEPNVYINIFRWKIGTEVYSKSAAIYRSNFVTTARNHRTNNINCGNHLPLLFI